MWLLRRRIDLARRGAWSAAIRHAPRALGGAVVTKGRAQLIKETFCMGVILTLARSPARRRCSCNIRQAKSPTRRLLRKSAPGSTRSCDPESTSVCGDVGEVDLQSRSVAATRGWPAAAGQGARLIGVDLRSTQRGRPRVDFDRSRPAVDSARSPQGRLLSESSCGRLSEVAPGSALIGVDLRSSQRGVAPGSTFDRSDLHTAHNNGFVCWSPSVRPRTRGLLVCPAHLSLRLNSLNGRLVGNRNSEPRNDATRSQRHRSKCAL